MENGSAALTSGEGLDRHDSVCNTNTSIENMRFPLSNPTPPQSPTSASAPTSSEKKEKPHRAVSHKRSQSGSILSKLNFLRTTGDDGHARLPSRDLEVHGPKTPRADEDDEESAMSPTSPNEGDVASALKQSKARKRKGSLRKTALLGGRRFTLEGRERKNSLLQHSPSSKKQEALPIVPATPVGGDFNAPKSQDADEETEGPRKFSYEAAVAASSSDSGWSEDGTPPKLSLDTTKQGTAEATQPNGAIGQLSSPIDIKSATSVQSYASTTSDDDLNFDLPHTLAPALKSKAPPSNSSSYFPTPSTHSLPGRRSSAKPRSPLAVLTAYPSPAPELEEHDYTETAYWGWVILVVTWIVFTVGMGSCLEVWSWAWDVGETPYAPPELEDDPTLPIVGYYPALIVLTAVVCWVWVSVAWVGMKYFRHAKIEM